MSPALKLLPLFPTILRLRDEHGFLEEQDWRSWSWCNSEEIEICLGNRMVEKSATQILYHFSLHHGSVSARIPAILVKEGGGGLKHIAYPTRSRIKTLQSQRANEAAKGRPLTEFLVPAPWVQKVFKALARDGHHLARFLDGKVYVVDEQGNRLYPWE